MSTVLSRSMLEEVISKRLQREGKAKEVADETAKFLIDSIISLGGLQQNGDALSGAVINNFAERT